MSEKLSQLVIRIQNAISATLYGKIHRFSQAYASQCKSTGNGCINQTIQVIRAIQDAADVEKTITQKDAYNLICDILDTICATAQRITIPSPRHYGEFDKKDMLENSAHALSQATAHVQQILAAMDYGSEEGEKISRKERQAIKAAGQKVIEAIAQIEYTLDHAEE